jgi:copper oxidase (laccase) domain-containing protein
VGVTAADCVPITFVERPTAATLQAVATIHAGWRGAAAGILERGLARISAAFGSRPADLHMHLGPSICGECYEVGPEVHEALGLARPGRPTPVDLARVLAERAVRAGVDPARITRSAWCTRCDRDDLLYSHRGGDAGRQVSFVAIARQPRRLVSRPPEESTS